MANRLKEDEKNERIIRGLLKIAPNRRCINCNSLGPQYVCTNFWTFVCTTCSGIHREFTHRVKSVSMAKFTSQEVNFLQQGGNQKAKEIYFKEFDSQRHPYPDSSNVDRLRDFIKHVYVEKRYSGDRGGDKPPRGKTGDKDDAYESRRPDSYRSDSRSPPYEDTYADRRYSDRSGHGARYDRGRYDEKGYDERRNSYDEKRSPGQYESDRGKYDRGYQENRRYDDSHKTSPGQDNHRFDNTYKRSPGHLESGGDRFRFDDRRFPDAPDRRRPEERSPNYQRDFSPPPVRPVRDILGDDVPTLRVSDFPRANGSRDGEGSSRSLPEIRKEFRGQRTASSSSMGSVEGTSPTLKRVNSGSLIDFSAEPEPSSAAIQPDAFAVSSVKQPSTAVQQDLFAISSFKQPSTTAHQDPFAVPFFSQPSPAVQQDLFGVSSVPQPSTASASDNGGWATFDWAPQSAPAPVPVPAPAPASDPLQSLAPAPAPLAPVPGTSAGNLDPFGKANNAGQWSWAPQQAQGPALFASGANNFPTVPQSVQASNGISGSQSWNGVLSSTASSGLNASQNVQPVQAAAKPPLPNMDVGSQQVQQTAGSTKNARREIPEDLFAPLYPEPVVHNTGFHLGSQLGGVSGVQYPFAGMSLPGQAPFSRPPSKSTNPFDTMGESPVPQGSLFPSMGSLQAALPDFTAPTMSGHGPAVGTLNGQWTPPSQAPVPHPLATPGYFMGQQVPKQVQSGAVLPSN
ncbi:hypothetical protein KI387_033328, partial [Taxus chinensis]